MKYCFCLFLLLNFNLWSISSIQAQTSNYTLVVEGFDWGAAASKVILDLPETISIFHLDDYDVQVERTSHCAPLDPKEASGKLSVLHSYLSDARGNRTTTGEHITIVLHKAPWESLGAPVKYYWNNPKCPGNVWIDFHLNIKNLRTGQVWNNEKDRIVPLIDDFNLNGSYTHDAITLQYADYQPSNIQEKRPLIIWLHGGGEGGTDTSIPLIANRAANYAAPEIQNYFEGAYVLVPQSPTFWMDKGNKEYTRGAVDDIYYESLMELIKKYVSDNPQIDQNRIYLGGCSNGGYMTIKLLLEYPNYFAAGFPVALAYFNEFISDNEVDILKNQSIWFVHSADDPVTQPDITVVPLYHRLIKAGAQDIHLSYYDHVVDITNQYGGDAYRYNGHLSWIYAHTNKCQLDFDGSPVTIDEQPVTLMGWLARRVRY